MKVKLNNCAKCGEKIEDDACSGYYVNQADKPIKAGDVNTSISFEPRMIFCNSCASNVDDDTLMFAGAKLVMRHLRPQ